MVILTGVLDEGVRESLLGPLGMDIHRMGLIALIWYILVIIGDWKIFKKADIPGWHSIVPFLNMYEEFELCWNGYMGIFYMVALAGTALIPELFTGDVGTVIAGILGLFTAVLHIIESFKLSRSFDHGFIFGIFLILFERLGRVLLGFGKSKYIGPQ